MNGMMRLAACALILGSSAVASADTLQNDGFTAGMAVGYQGGFTAGEEAAVELTPPNSNSWKVDKVRFLYGTTALTQTITLRIYAASANATPGAVLFMDDFSVTGSADAMVEIDLTALSVLVNGAFRVSIGFQNAGNPSVASDSDGSLDGTKNFFKIEDGLGGHVWQQTDFLEIIKPSGDWVIRADVTDQGGTVGTPDAGPNDPDASTGDAGSTTGGADAGTGASCTLNSDCTLGSYCGDDSTCAIDCRTDIDCNDDTSCEPALGKCEKKSSGGGCSTSGGSGLGSLGAGLLLIGLIALRRRSHRG
jgi:MYXO-CTERM domain-containing protein